ncbi:xanthine dehydrogenase family protein subunit M [Alphaproteobacteria bacterium]|nr:xanthine dehydrogenase family protein subunit M [Alphaproteobacteria bacterium]
MYYRPDKINEALYSLSREKLTIAAGCTDLLPSTQQDNLGDNILDISGIKSLRNIYFENGFRRIGSGVTWTDIVENNNLPNCYDMLKECSLQIGSQQIQNLGTIGGNLCNASPAADGVPCLLSLDASIELLSVNGKRVLKLEDFIKGSRKTELQNNEILSAILIPKEAEIGRSSFLKLGARKYLVISIAMIACKLNLEKDFISDIAISVGSCSAVAKRIKSLENLLIGKSIKDELTTIILNYNYKNYLSPISDIRGTNTYRLKASKVLVKDTIIKTINKFNLKD